MLQYQRFDTAYEPHPGTPLARSHPLATGLAACWFFNEGAGQKTSDSTSFQNHATLKGSSTPAFWSGGLSGWSIGFSASGQYLDCGLAAAVSNLTRKTIVYRYNANSAGQGAVGHVVDKTGFWTGTNSTSIRFNQAFSTSPGTWDSTAGTLSFSKTQLWHVTYDNSSTANNPSFYLNGTLQSSSRVNAPAGTANSDSANTLYLGNNSSFNQTFDGKIDFIRIYNRILTADEIRLDATAPFAFIYPERLHATYNVAAVARRPYGIQIVSVPIPPAALQ